MNKAKKKQPLTSRPETLENTNFDLELLWCIETLDMSLQSGKLSQREAERIEKSIKTLKNPKEVFIKKRQLMSNLLGDYRAKMEQQQKASLANQKLVKVSAIEPNKKSMFLRKSLKAESGSEVKLVNIFNKLNLTTDSPDDASGPSTSSGIAHVDTPDQADDVFRFDFNVECEETVNDDKS